MIRRVPFLAVLLGAGAVLAASAAEPAKGSLDGLVKNSPFGTAASPGAAGSENSQLEFRGMFTDKGEQFFSFFDPATRTSQWVGLKETGTPYAIQGYDSATQSVKVVFRNQTFNLTLKRAQVLVQALPPPQAGPQPTPNGQPGPAVVAAGSPDEAARLAQVAEEIRRRRALRAQGQPAPQPVPANPAPPSTPNRP